MQKEAHLIPVDSIAQSAGLRVYVLGPLRIERDGITLSLSRRKVEALLVYLLLHPEPQTRDYLATLFWGDSSDAQARHSLRTALATVRKEVAADLLLADRDQVQWNPDFPCWVDLYTLLAVALELDTISIDLLLTKIALWQGELLTGFYEDWVLLEREHYREQLLKLCLQATQALRARSEYIHAITVAQRILTVDPANEHAHQHLMFCYMAAGDRSAALRQYELCERTLEAELDVPPQPETTALYHWIRQQSGEEASIAAKITNLPIPLTSFVGRTDATAAVKRLLNPTSGKTRLLTLTGAGGSGKTRLAIQVATDLIDRFADGVWWVELATLTTGEQVARAVVKALGVTERPHEPAWQSVVDFLGEKALLLVLDNCEHLIADSAQLATALLQRCPHLQILTTSREALNVTGEIIWQVPTLGLPMPQQVVLTDVLLQFECVRLFVERASAIQPGFQLTLATAPAVVNICTQLDGIPLAIELAAARVKVLPVEQIAARLTSAIGARFTLLTQGSRTVLPRQQTLRAAIDWSYDLLDEAERQLFRIVALFRGGFTLETLEQLVEAGSTPSTIDLLTQLVDKSLVIVEPQTDGHRYRLLETLREYALEQFAEAELQRWQHRHAALFVQISEQAEAALTGPQQQRWLIRLEADHANLRAALDFLLTQQAGVTALQLATAIYRFWEIRGYVNEALAWLQKALTASASPPAPLRAKTLNAIGFLHLRQGDNDRAQPLLAESLQIFQRLEDEYALAEVLQNLAIVTMRRGEFATAQQQLEESLAICRAHNDQQGIARALNYLGNLAYDQDKVEIAHAYFRESLPICQALGNQVTIANVLFNLGHITRASGDLAAAHAYYEECLIMSRTIGHQGLTSVALRSLGRIALDQGEYTLAQRYGEESLRLMQRLGDQSNMAFTLILLGDIARRIDQAGAALAFYNQALSIFVKQNYRWPIYNTLECIAHLLLAVEQHPTVAARILGAARAIRQELDHPVVPVDQAEYDRHLNLLHQQLGATLADQLQAEGQTTPIAQIVAEAQALRLP